MSVRDVPVLPRDCARRYRAVRLLGSGGFGKVIEAIQLSLERRVVVKLLHAETLGDAEQVARFENEARVTALLRHPNIVTLLDHGAEAGAPWIVYEFIDGQDLRALLAAGRLPLDLARLAVSQVCAALEEAHGRGILHRDIKPENVLRTAEGLCKVADFGLAKWGGAGSVKTRVGLLLGTPAYLSPEQIQGRAATAASDLYAVGVLLYELLTGRLPFEADSPLAMLEKHLTETALPPSAWRRELPASLDSLAMRLLQKEPGARPASAGVVRDELSSGSEPASRATSPTMRLKTGAPRPSPSARGTVSLEKTVLPPPSVSRRWPVALAAATLLAGAGSAFWRARELPPAQPPAIDASRPRGATASQARQVLATATTRQSLDGRKASAGPPRPASVPSTASPTSVVSPEARIDELRVHVQKFPKDWTSYLELARAYDAVGNWNWSLGKYTYVARNAEPRTSRLVAQAHLGRGRCLMRQEKPDEAADALRKSLELSPDEPETLDLLSQALGQNPAGRDEAIRLAKRLIALRPGWPGLAKRLTGWLVGSGRMEEAVPHAEQALAQDKHDRWVQHHLANWYYWNGKRPLAIPLLEELVKAGAADMQVFVMLGECYSDAGRPDRAEAIYLRALTRWPDGPPILAALAAVQAGTGRLTDAERNLRKVRARRPNHSEDRVSLADVLVRLGKKAEARELLEEGERLAPGDTWTQIGLASLLVGERQLDRASALYEKVLAREPLQEAALTGLADLRDKQGRFDDSIALNRKLIAGIPRLWDRGRQIADTLDKAGRPKETLAEFQRLRKEHPEAEWIRPRLAEQLAKQGQVDEAMAQLSGLSGDDPWLIIARRTTAVALIEAHREADARSQLRILLAGAPRENWAWATLGGSLKSEGRTTEALQAFEHYVAAAPDNPMSLLEAANLALEAGNTILGESALRRAIAVAATDPGPRVFLAKLLMGRGEFAEAASHLEVAAQTPAWRDEALRLLAEARAKQSAGAAEPATSAK